MGSCVRQARLEGKPLACPVIQDQLGKRIQKPLSFNTLKEIRKINRENGASSPFTKGVLNALSENCHMMTWDWQTLAKTTLDASQHLLWRAEHTEICEQ